MIMSYSNIIIIIIIDKVKNQHCSVSAFYGFVT